MSAIVNAAGDIDFEQVLPVQSRFPGEDGWQDVSAERAVERALVYVNACPLPKAVIADQLQWLTIASKFRWPEPGHSIYMLPGNDREKMVVLCERLGRVFLDYLLERGRPSTPSATEKFVADCQRMLVAYLRTGYKHSIDARAELWGCGRNAVQDLWVIRPNGRTARAIFNTAWSSPTKVFLAWSAKCPDAKIVVRFADEDRPRNAGKMMFLAGEIVVRQETPVSSSATWPVDVRNRWYAFAGRVWRERLENTPKAQKPLDGAAGVE
jgi:hypothetical protein